MGKNASEGFLARFRKRGILSKEKELVLIREKCDEIVRRITGERPIPVGINVWVGSKVKFLKIFGKKIPIEPGMWYCGRLKREEELKSVLSEIKRLIREIERSEGKKVSQAWLEAFEVFGEKIKVKEPNKWARLLELQKHKEELTRDMAKIVIVKYTGTFSVNIEGPPKVLLQIRDELFEQKDKIEKLELIRKV